MARLLLWILIGFAVAVAYRAVNRSQARDAADRRRPGGRPALPSEPMVACRICGLNVPQSEAVRTGSAAEPAWFCSEAHRRLGQEQR